MNLYWLLLIISLNRWKLPHSRFWTRKVAQFIQTNIICRYRVLHKIISNNRLLFKGETEKLLRQFNIQHHKFSLYCPQTNGAVEAANKNIGWILKKSMKNYKDWHLQLPYALWGYRTSIRSSTGAIPYSLVYGMEAVLPIEMSVCSLRTELENEISEVDWFQSRYDQLCIWMRRYLRACITFKVIKGDLGKLLTRK